MTENGEEQSGTFIIEDVENFISSERATYLPDITRATFQRIGKGMDRLTKLFGDVFYHKPGRKSKDVVFVEEIYQSLLNGEIDDGECMVGHIFARTEGMTDRIFFSTPKSLILFGCEPQRITKEHPEPRHPLLMLLDPKEGMFLRPSAASTLNFGQIVFDRCGVTEDRATPYAFDQEEKKVWKKHLERWRIDDKDMDGMRKIFGLSILELLRWKHRNEPQPAPHIVSYADFHRRLFDASHSVSAGLNAVNGLIEKKFGGGPDKPDSYKTY